MQKIKKILLKRFSKGIIDILLIIGTVLSIKTARTACYSWASLHCIVSIIWYALMLVHIWQHWAMTKAVVSKWKVLKRNKITFLTIAVFILMTLNIIVFVFEVNSQLVRIHHILSHVFWKVIIIHTIQKFKRLVACFR